MIARKIYFSGRVQGVGFRYAVCQIATQFDVAGWVENLLDGRVEVQVKGEPNEIAKFVERICSDHHLSSCINDIDELDTRIETLENINSFTVRY